MQVVMQDAVPLPAPGAASATPQPAIAPFARLTEEKMAALRYRCRDVQRGLTPAVVRAARTADVKAEVLNSTRLQVSRCAHSWLLLPRVFDMHAASRGGSGVAAVIGICRARVRGPASLRALACSNMMRHC